MSKFGFQVTNYIDDIIGHSICSKAQDSFNTLFYLLQNLGFDISSKKIVAPSTRVTCLGVDIDIENFTISVTHEKIQEILQICEEWSSRTVVSK